MKYFSLFFTLWLLYIAGRGTVPIAMSDGDAGKPLRRGTRAIFLFAGLSIAVLTFLMFYRPHP